MDKRRRKYRRPDPVKKYLKMKKPDQIPIELKQSLEKKDQLNKGHLVDIYGVSGEKQLRHQKHKLQELRSRSQSAAYRASLML